MNAVTHSPLFREQAFFAGSWRDAQNGARQDVTNPANGDRLGSVPRLAAPEIEQTIISAQKAFESWRSEVASVRANMLKEWRRLIVEHKADLAHILTIEQGKPLRESHAELDISAAYIEWFAEEARRVDGDIIPSPSSRFRTLVTREPVGVCAAITPWNFPASMIARKVAPALAAGCSVIVKPSEQTPFIALALGLLAEKAGLTKGVLNIVTGNSREIVKVLTDSPIVRKLSFTGSTAVGKLLMAQCATTVKRMSMELGGNAPIIIFDDANLNDALTGLMALKYRNGGQTCVCANRIFVQNTILDKFLDDFAKRVRALKVGSGLAADTDIGPLITRGAVQEMTDIVDRAVRQGAKVLAGGRVLDEAGNFFEPTVLAYVTPSMDVARKEVFGPIAPVIGFDTEAEVIAHANDTEYGLASYVYTRDLGRAWRVSDALEYGLVGINEVAISNEVAPFGGVKQSGFGTEGSKYGINEYLNIKYRAMGGLSA